MNVLAINNKKPINMQGGSNFHVSMRTVKKANEMTINAYRKNYNNLNVEKSMKNETIREIMRNPEQIKTSFKKAWESILNYGEANSENNIKEHKSQNDIDNQEPELEPKTLKEAIKEGLELIRNWKNHS